MSYGVRMSGSNFSSSIFTLVPAVTLFACVAPEVPMDPSLPGPADSAIPSESPPETIGPADPEDCPSLF